MYYHPKNEKQIIEIFKSIKIPKNEQDNSEDLADIKDGTIYKN